MLAEYCAKRRIQRDLFVAFSCIAQLGESLFEASLHLGNGLLGALIVFFLIVEPYGMARLWHTIKDKLRLWPFPY